MLNIAHYQRNVIRTTRNHPVPVQAAIKGKSTSDKYWAGV